MRKVRKTKAYCDYCEEEVTAIEDNRGRWYCDQCDKNITEQVNEDQFNLE